MSNGVCKFENCDGRSAPCQAWTPECGCRFANCYSGEVIMCEDCGKSYLNGERQ